MLEATGGTNKIVNKFLAAESCLQDNTYYMKEQVLQSNQLDKRPHFLRRP